MLSRRSVLTGAAGLALIAPHAARAQFADVVPDTLPDAGAKIVAVKPWQPGSFPIALGNGSMTSLSAYLGRAIVINVWATWCPPCLAELPTLVRLSQNLQRSAIAVLPVAVESGTTGTVAQFLKAHNFDLPVMSSPASAPLLALNAPNVPTTVLINSNGYLVGQAVGGDDWSTLDAALQIQNMLLA